MSSLSNILQQGRRALQVQQLAMQVIGHNTTNAGTEGYSRRRIDLGTSPPGSTGQWNLGSGVDVDRLGRIRDTLLDSQIRDSTTVSSYWSSREDQLGRVEDVFNALGDNNLGSLMDDFWQGWQDLANDPESMTPRYSLRDRASALVSTLKRVHKNLSDQIEDVNARITAGAEQVNDLTSAIAELNVRIVQSELGGEEASDLRDSRDLLVEQLSGLTDVSVQEQSDGSINVYSGGHIMVQRDLAVPLTIDRVDTDPKREVVLTLGTSGSHWKANGGELGALFEQRDQELPKLLEQLDSFAREFATAVNSVHTTGYGLDGSSGNEFFAPGVTGVQDLAVSNAILEDPSRIASASASDAPGDNSIALAIAGLQTQATSSGITLDQMLRNIPLEAGSKRAAAIQQNDIEAAVLNNAVNRRFSISGVSLDEEMAHLLEAQKAYEAAAKIVQTVDEMMQTVLSLKQ
ncbi:MAG: flagellar hook-associated protein FlgK [Calditrichaeota bacterium]|nr:flagellar hook-associated protein FlgK [Calditrichota bacterium]MCB9368793.1 flagellar hook-associated protein FlgK [Calditrichota bacterium]